MDGVSVMKAHDVTMEVFDAMIDEKPVVILDFFREDG